MSARLLLLLSVCGAVRSMFCASPVNVLSVVLPCPDSVLCAAGLRCLLSLSLHVPHAPYRQLQVPPVVKHTTLGTLYEEPCIVYFKVSVCVC